MNQSKRVSKDWMLWLEEYRLDQYQLVSTKVQKSKRLKSKQVHLESDEGPSPLGVLTDVADLLCSPAHSRLIGGASGFRPSKLLETDLFPSLLSS